MVIKGRNKNYRKKIKEGRERGGGERKISRGKKLTKKRYFFWVFWGGGVKLSNNKQENPNRTREKRY